MAIRDIAIQVNEIRDFDIRANKIQDFDIRINDIRDFTIQRIEFGILDYNHSDHTEK